MELATPERLLGGDPRHICNHITILEFPFLPPFKSGHVFTVKKNDCIGGWFAKVTGIDHLRFFPLNTALPFLGRRWNQAQKRDTDGKGACFGVGHECGFLDRTMCDSLGQDGRNKEVSAGGLL